MCPGGISAIVIDMKKMSLKRTSVLLAGAAAGITGAWLATSAINARRLVIEQVEIKSKRLPRTFDGVKLAFVSDVHAGPFLSATRMARLVDRVNSLEPDLLVLGGDNVGGWKNGDEIFYPEASRFRAPLGKFSVLGNHDAWEGIDKARLGLREAGFVPLENKNTAVAKGGQRIMIAGLADLWTGRPDIKKAAAGINGRDFAILVSHNPDVFAEAIPETMGLWDLALSGHTHGGQFLVMGRGFTKPTEFGARYRTGWRTENGVPILVSNGVGTVDAPLRHAARPEIQIITFRKG
jgi:predicted MPP superfamily phosphohydrolase